MFKSGAPEGLAVPVPHVIPVILLLKYSFNKGFLYIPLGALLSFEIYN